MELTHEMQQARFGLLKEMPYLAPAVLRMRMVPVPSMPTLSVDRYWRCYYNPEFVAAASPEDRVAYLRHEVSHLLRNHLRRGEWEQHSQLTNIAGDLEINAHIPEMQKDPFCYPGSKTFPEAEGFKPGLMLEEYLELLHKKQNKQQEQGQKGKPQAGQPGDEESNSAGQGTDGKFGDFTPCGSGSGGKVEEWELPDDGKGPGEFEKKAIEKSVAEQIKDHKAKNPGRTPADWDVWAEKILVRPIPWDQWLRRHVRVALGLAAGMVDYSYKRRARRPSSEIIFPGLVKPRVKLAVVVDTSGSMSPEDLGKALGTIHDMIRAMGVEEGLHVLSCSMTTTVTQRVFSASKVTLKGGGGTDMRVGIGDAEKLKPSAIVVVTDGYTPWPETKGTIPVFAVIVPNTGTGMNVAEDRGIPEWIPWKVVETK